MWRARCRRRSRRAMWRCARWCRAIPRCWRALTGAETVHGAPICSAAPARVLAGTGGGLAVFVIDAPHLFARRRQSVRRPGRRRLARTIRCASPRLRASAPISGWAHVAGFVPDVVHAHDWQAGLTPAYLQFEAPAGRPGTVMTIHNLAFQGQVPAALLGVLGLPPLVLHDGRRGVLRRDRHAEGRAVASPTGSPPSRPPMPPRSRHRPGGMGMGGLLARPLGRAVRHRQRHRHDGVGPGDRSADRRAVRCAAAGAARGATRRRWRRGSAWPAGRTRLLFGMVSRLTEQKGIDLVLGALPALLGVDACLAVLGRGDAGLRADWFRPQRPRIRAGSAW